MRIWVIEYRKSGRPDWKLSIDGGVYATCDREVAEGRALRLTDQHSLVEYRAVAYVREVTGTDTLEGK